MESFDGITAKAGAALVGVPRHHMVRIAAEKGIRRRVLPGVPILYDRNDCLRVGREAIVTTRAPELAGSSN